MKLTETDPRFMSVRDTAHVLGISVPTVHRWIRRGIIPSIRMGGRRLVDVAELSVRIETAHCPVQATTEEAK